MIKTQLEKKQYIQEQQGIRKVHQKNLNKGNFKYSLKLERQKNKIFKGVSIFIKSTNFFFTNIEWKMKENEKIYRIGIGS